MLINAAYTQSVLDNIHLKVFDGMGKILKPVLFKFDGHMEVITKNGDGKRWIHQDLITQNAENLVIRTDKFKT